MGTELKDHAVSLFAGIGATAKALADLGHHVHAVEMEPVFVDTLRSNLGEHTILQANVKEINWRRFAERIVGRLRVLTGGPPCQPFSQGGLQTGEYDPRDCIPDYIEAVRVLQPEVFLMEEVWTLTWAKNSVYFTKVLADLRAAGYVVEHRVIKMDEYGVDQARKRLFVVGVRYDVVEKRGYGVRWPEKNLAARRPMATALGWTKAVARKRALLAPVFGEPTWVFERPSTTVVGSFRPEVQAAPGYRKAGDGPRQNTPGSVVITEEEALVLQGLPRDWTVKGNEAQRRLQIGNSCPPSMTKQIVEVNL